LWLARRRPRLIPGGIGQGGDAARRQLGAGIIARISGANGRVGEEPLAHRTRLRELKDGLGPDHFEGRGYLGWHRHVTLVALD
jgi:hypothetical protein